MTESILKNLKSDLTYYDSQFPELSTMIARAGIKITPFKDLTGDQKAYAKTYLYENPQDDQLVVQWPDMSEQSIYGSLPMALIEWYTDQDFAGGFPEEIPEGGTVYDLNTEFYNIKGIESILRFDYALGESTSIATLKRFGIKP